mgnify:FL=1
MSTLPLLSTLIDTAAQRAFATRNGAQAVNADTVNNFVNYLGDVFKLGAEQGVVIDRKAILDAAKITFLAMPGSPDLATVFDTAVAKILDIRDSKTSDIDLSKISEEAKRAPFAQHIASVLNDSTINYSGAEELNTKDQKIFIQQAVATAIEQSTNEEKQISPKEFKANLTKIIKANAGSLNATVVAETIDSLNELAIRSSAFVIIPELKGLAQAFDLEAIKAAKVDLSQVSVEDKYDVLQFMNDLLVKNNDLAQDGKSLDLKAEIDKDLNSGQKAYLASLIQSFNEAGGTNGLSNLTKMLSKSLPDLAMTGIIGAAVGWLCGGNAGLGAIAGAILTFFGKLDDLPEPDTRDKPPAFELFAKPELESLENKPA